MVKVQHFYSIKLDLSEKKNNLNSRCQAILINGLCN